MSAEGAKNVSWPWLSPLRRWGSLTMAFIGKFVCIYIYIYICVNLYVCTYIHVFIYIIYIIYTYKYIMPALQCTFIFAYNMFGAYLFMILTSFFLKQY